MCTTEWRWSGPHTTVVDSPVRTLSWLLSVIKLIPITDGLKASQQLGYMVFTTTARRHLYFCKNPITCLFPFLCSFLAVYQFTSIDMTFFVCVREKIIGLEQQQGRKNTEVPFPKENARRIIQNWRIIVLKCLEREAFQKTISIQEIAKETEKKRCHSCLGLRIHIMRPCPWCVLSKTTETLYHLHASCWPRESPSTNYWRRCNSWLSGRLANFVGLPHCSKSLWPREDVPDCKEKVNEWI